MLPTRLERQTAITLVFATLGLSLAAILSVLGPVMHESDQASLLEGVVRLARGDASPFAANFYNYDKQCLTYWLVSALHLLLPGLELITLGNVTSFLIFWAGVFSLVAGNVRHLNQAALLCACLLTPALWLHSAFLASAFVSAGFLLLAWSVWLRSSGRPWHRLTAGMLFIVAIGCRADAVLILPWFAWTLSSPRILRQWHAWGVLAIASTLALGLGRLIAVGDKIELHPPFLHPRIYLAYVVFGLGASALIIGWLGVTLLAVARKRGRRRLRVAGYYALGLPALLLPSAYYSLQLFSTRYWVLQVCALLGLLITRRGRVLLEGMRGPRTFAIAVFAASLLPLFVGLHLPFPSRPRLVLSDATVFPTADGVQPMGALVAFLRRSATSPDYIIDHNQATWLAARYARLQPDDTGRVPVLDFALRSYVLLAAALQGHPTYIVSAEAPWFYADRRDLLRVYHTPRAYAASDRLAFAHQVVLEPAGPDIAGYKIFRARQGSASDPAWQEQLVLARALRGSEYRGLPMSHALSPISLPRSSEGKTLAFFSREIFSLQLTSVDGSTRKINPEFVSDANLYLALVPGGEWWGMTVATTKGSPTGVITIHPDYMASDKL